MKRLFSREIICYSSNLFKLFLFRYLKMVDKILHESLATHSKNKVKWCAKEEHQKKAFIVFIR